MPDGTCCFLAADFDKTDWQRAVLAFMKTCKDHEIPYAVERSRSGNGAHVWIFFEQRTKALDARRLGFFLLDKAMENYPELPFESYDRLFPNQDSLPSGGFGNLIALPLQFQARQYDNSVFLDDELTAHPDQWSYLEGIKRLSNTKITEMIRKIESCIQSSTLKPWEQSLPNSHAIIPNCPPKPKIVLANRIYIPITTLPSKLVARLKRLATFANPVFFKNQSMRFSTHGIPRYICLAEVEQSYLIIPRGCLDDALEILKEQEISAEIEDKRESGKKLEGIRFLGQLRTDQGRAVEKLIAHDVGVFHAPTAFGKTVTAIGIIVKRQTNTLILTHTRQLVDQWRERLSVYLGNVEIGVIAGNKRKPTGRIDIATYQSFLNRKNNSIDPAILEYGQIIVDECHHISAPNYDRLLSEVRSRYVLGLTATTERQDGHQPIIFMQAGPVRYRIKEEKNRQFEQLVYVRNLSHFPPHHLADSNERPHIADVFRWLTGSEIRNQQIIDDIVLETNQGFNPLVLTERRQHAELINQRLSDLGFETIVLRGGMDSRERREAANQMQSAQILVATGKYIGEGFDLPRLDRLFLALPISWKGSLAQYAGRIHRNNEGKETVAIYDYVDTSLPMLQRMFTRRCKGYEAMGYRLISDDTEKEIQASFPV
jgi:superfamily II DNA or RNA helicase